MIDSLIYIYIYGICILAGEYDQSTPQGPSPFISKVSSNHQYRNRNRNRKKDHGDNIMIEYLATDSATKVEEEQEHSINIDDLESQSEHDTHR